MRLTRLVLVVLFFAAPSAGLFSATTPPPATTAPARPVLPPHPRLLATSADFGRIRAAIAQPGPLQDAFEVLKAAAEAEYDAPPCTRVMVGRRLLDTSRLAIRRIWNAALLYQLTQDRRWAKRAEKEMIALADFSDWNPSHFLDVAEAAAAIAIGFDWTFDALTRESREVLRDALIQNALIPGSSDNAPWRRYHNNWRQVCEGGLALAALSIASGSPEIAWPAIDRARRNVPAIFNTYEPAGAYVEGPMYWDYGTTYHVLLIEALRTATGSAGNLADNAAFLKSASVLDLLTAPSGAWFNYGDSNYRRGFNPVVFWFARETRQPALAAFDARLLSQMAHACRQTGLDGNALPTRFLALALLWMDPAPPPTPPPPPASWSTTGPNPLAIFRGDGPNALYAGIKGGRARNSHAHMDAGSFVLELGGQRWTADLGKPDYDFVERAGIDLFGKDRWKVYAVGPHSHSIPLINDTPPNDETTATLYAFSARDQSAVINLTPVYAPKVTRLHRSLRVTSPASIELRDSFDGLAVDAKYRFSWMTRTTVLADATGATLTQNGRTLRLDVTSDAPFRVVAEDASLPAAKWDQPNPGLSRVSVIATAKNKTHFINIRASLLTAPSNFVLAVTPKHVRKRAPAESRQAASLLSSVAPVRHEPELVRTLATLNFHVNGARPAPEFPTEAIVDVNDAGP